MQMQQLREQQAAAQAGRFGMPGGMFMAGMVRAAPGNDPYQSYYHTCSVIQPFSCNKRM